MKKTLFLIFSLVTIIGLGLFLGARKAEAYYGTSYDLLGTTYYDFSNGVSGSSYDLLGTTYYNFSDGMTGTSYNLLGTTYYNWNGPSYSYSYDWDY